ncbi:MAG: Mpv17/PMP22 family protein, partial [Candidatus Margulisiibacteriota bacterium]
PEIGSPCRRIYIDPKIRNVGRAILPFAGTAAAGALLYNVWPAFHDAADHLRQFLGRYPKASEMTASGLTMGFFPDYFAQKYEGNKLNFRRLIGMATFQAVAGGVVLREYYNFINDLIPGTGFAPNTVKISIDQAFYSPPYLAVYLTYTNFIRNKPWDGFLGKLKDGVFKFQPRSWGFWIPGAIIVYNVPSDLRIYAVNFLSLVWFSILSKWANEEKECNFQK